MEAGRQPPSSLLKAAVDKTTRRGTTRARHRSIRGSEMSRGVRIAAAVPQAPSLSTPGIPHREGEEVREGDGEVGV